MPMLTYQEAIVFCGLSAALAFHLAGLAAVLFFRVYSRQDRKRQAAARERHRLALVAAEAASRYVRAQRQGSETFKNRKKLSRDDAAEKALLLASWDQHRAAEKELEAAVDAFDGNEPPG